MPFTATQLNTFYTNDNLGMAPDAATQALFAAYAQQNANGQLTDAQTIALVSNTAQTKATTDVALATYQFYTGSTPTTGATGGLNYLVNNPGTGFNTSYFNGTGTGASATSPGTGGFNLENRYYNESVALATNSSTNGTFISTYGSLSINDTIRLAYEQIVGTGSVGAANAAAAVASIQGSVGYFTQVAQQRAGGVDVGGAAGQNIALKAVIVGYILEEGIKADVGTYAKAIDNFDAALAQGTATSGANLLTAYAPGTAGDTLGGTTTGNSGVAGVTITYGATANGTAISLTSADPAFRSTVNNDTLVLTGGTITGTTVDLNGGNDTVIGGTIGTAAGTTGSVLTLGGGNDTAGTLAAPLVVAQGTANTGGTVLIDGGAGTDTLHISTTGVATGGTNASVTITGVETLFVQGNGGAATIDATNFTGVSQLWAEGANAVTMTGVAAASQVGVSNLTGAASFTYGATGAETLNITGTNTGGVTVAGTGATNTLTLAHTANVNVGGLTSSALTIVDSGTSEINLGTVAFSGTVTSDSINLSSASRAALNFTTAATATAGTDTITLGAGNDVLNINLGVQKNSTIVTGAGADTITFAGTNGLGFTDGAGGTKVTGNVTVTSTAVTTLNQITDFAKGVDHVNFETGGGFALYNNTSGNAAYVGNATLFAAATAAASLTAVGQVTTFEFGGSTYIFQNNTTTALDNGDTLIQLVGVTGASVNATAGGVNTGDIHFG